MSVIAQETQGIGLLAFQADIDVDYLLRFQEWHNCEHMPERVAIPGFISGVRYRSATRANRFLMCYRTQTPDVLASAAYRAALDRPTEWTREALTHFRRPKRNAYRLVNEGGAGRQPAEGPYLGVARFDRSADWAPASADALLHLAATVTASRWRLYELDRGATGIKTSERQIYGGEPGSERWLAWFEMPRPDAWKASSAELEGWLGVQTDTDDTRDDSPHELYWLDFALRSPTAASSN